MSYVGREIDITVSLGMGAFGEDGFDTVTLSGLRVSATIIKAGGLSMSSAEIRVYGMPLSLMNKLSTLGLRLEDTRNNKVRITAGDTGSNKAIVFDGTINNGEVDFSLLPDVAFHINAHVGLIDAVRPVAPTSYKGSADVVTIMAGLATLAEMNFQNSGVSGVRLNNPYFAGSTRDQILACADHAGIEVIIDDGSDGSNIVAIWPRGGFRDGVIPLISAETGLVGYPNFTSQGISFRTLYNPGISYGSLVELQSIVTPACGKWVVHTLIYDLESQQPGGAWFATVDAHRPGNSILGK